MAPKSGQFLVRGANGVTVGSYERDDNDGTFTVHVNGRSAVGATLKKACDALPSDTAAKSDIVGRFGGF